MDKYERFELEQKQEQGTPKPAGHTVRVLIGLALIIRIALSLIAIAIVFGVYTALQAQFETIVVSILLMIFAMVSGYVNTSDQQFLDIRKLLGGPATEREEATAVTIGLFNLVTVFVVDLIALWHLMKAIGWL